MYRGGEAKEGAAGEAMVGFIKRSEAWDRKQVAEREEAIGKKKYEALLTRKICPSCIQVPRRAAPASS